MSDTPSPTAGMELSANLATLRDVVRRFGWLYRIRPQVFVEPIYRLVGPPAGRAILNVSGSRLFVDPFSTAGWDMVDGKEYEPDMVRLIKASVPRGGVFFDVGANEGVFSAMAAAAMGKGGLVIAVEPQSRLRDILEINLALNCKGEFRIFRNAISTNDGETLRLNLGPTSHSGGSSIVRAYRWRQRTESVTTRSVDSIVAELGDRRIDMMKIDFEGFEPEVVCSAEMTLRAKRVAVLAVDYHGSILATRNIDPLQVDSRIRAHGYVTAEGSPEGGYVVYKAS